MRVKPFEDLEMNFLTRDEHWSRSFVGWSRDVHGSTVRMEPLNDLEMTIKTCAEQLEFLLSWLVA